MFLVAVVVVPGHTEVQILLVTESGSAPGKEMHVSKAACWAKATRLPGGQIYDDSRVRGGSLIHLSSVLIRRYSLDGARPVFQGFLPNVLS